MRDPAPVLSLIVEVAEALYAATESLEPIAVDLAYLFPAIARGTSVEWEEPTTEGDADLHTNTVKLFRHLFPPDHPVWNHIAIVQ